MTIKSREEKNPFYKLRREVAVPSFKKNSIYLEEPRRNHVRIHTERRLLAVSLFVNERRQMARRGEAFRSLEWQTGLHINWVPVSVLRHIWAPRHDFRSIITSRFNILCLRARAEFSHAVVIDTAIDTTDSSLSLLPGSWHSLGHDLSMWVTAGALINKTTRNETGEWSGELWYRREQLSPRVSEDKHDAEENIWCEVGGTSDL